MSGLRDVEAKERLRAIAARRQAPVPRREFEALQSKVVDLSVRIAKFEAALTENDAWTADAYVLRRLFLKNAARHTREAAL